jgi:hypothetical protein
MKIRKLFATLALATVLPLGAACGAGITEATDTTTTDSTTDSAATDSTTTDSAATAAPQGGEPGDGDVASGSTEKALIALVQEAYCNARLGRHRGHQPVQDVLDEVLTISHDELHVRMDSGQNLAAVATGLGIDPQTLIDALVESWSPAIDDSLAAGEITEAEAERYREALRESFTFRVTWNGQDATPTFSGLSA